MHIFYFRKTSKSSHQGHDGIQDLGNITEWAPDWKSFSDRFGAWEDQRFSLLSGTPLCALGSGFKGANDPSTWPTGLPKGAQTRPLERTSIFERDVLFYFAETMLLIIRRGTGSIRKWLHCAAAPQRRSERDFWSRLSRLDAFRDAFERSSGLHLPSQKHSIFESQIYSDSGANPTRGGPPECEIPQGALPSNSPTLMSSGHACAPTSA